MKKQSVVLFSGCLAVSSLCLGASLNSADKSQVTEAFVNKTFVSVPIANLNEQSIDNTFTGTLDDQGHIWGKFSKKPASQPQKDQGTYVMKDDGQLCLTWQHWNNGKEFCVYTYSTDNAYIIVDTKNMLHTVFMKSQMQAGNKLK